jgi:hypothetical protein
MGAVSHPLRSGCIPLWGGDRVDFALYQPVCFQFAQLFGEHALENLIAAMEYQATDEAVGKTVLGEE